MRLLWPAADEDGVLEQSATRDEHADFERYCTYLLQRSGPRLFGLLAAVVLVTWPVDFLLSGQAGHTASLAALRVSILLFLGGGAMVLPRLPAFERFPEWHLSALAVPAAVLAAWFASALGGFDSPVFHALSLVPLLVVLFPGSLPFRAALTSALAVVIWVVFALRQDGPALREGAAALQLVLVTGYSVALGQLVFMLTRTNFLVRHRLGVQEQWLRELNENLEAHVADKALELRRLARHLETTREDERKWIAREIHDELGQELTALRYGVAVARHQGGETMEPAFTELESLLDRTRSTMRRILGALRPRVLDELGLVPGLEWLVQDVGRRTGLTITLDVDPPALSLGGDAATTVFRIVQEALTNVVRHANASRAEVLIHLVGSRLVLEVKDDGVGISDAAQRSAGFGMVGIRERVDAVGGDAAWSTLEAGGTLLRVTAPYPVVAVESLFEPE